MRRITLLAVAAMAAALIVVPGASAQSGAPTQLFDASVSPAKVGTKKKPANLSLKVRPYFEFNQIASIFDAGGDFATSSATVKFDKNFVFNGKKFPQCSEAQAFNAGGKANCPSGSKVGKGSATAYAAAVKVTETVTVEIYNGPVSGGQVGTVMLKIKNIDGPVDVNTVLIGVVTKISDPKYGYQLIVKIPENIQRPAPGVFAVVTDFQTSVKATGKKKLPYISMKKCSPGGKLFFAYTGSFSDGTTQTVEKEQACK